MGCCCCCFSSRRSEPASTPTYYHGPRTSEERQPLSANHGSPSGISTGLLVDTNLDTSNPDTYTSPPLPLPYDVDFGHSHTPRRDNHGTKSIPVSEIEHSSSVAGLINANPSENSEMALKDADIKAVSVIELTPSYVFEDVLKKPVDPIVAVVEEEDCPICLEEYTEENPKLLTRCEHNFHLCCILEWMERSDTCPVCDQEVVIDEA
ncbi:hypothetical protein RND81_13G035800 [Saponaria officinalis]|uniref:RING-type E3 ubiquitin transferase n=1 Tax=Saponaria officinalis TaxID=3572 RepID=A0AAW1H3U5_SAPOF